jgi:O-antigen biosynthesis protein
VPTEDDSPLRRSTIISRLTVERDEARETAERWREEAERAWRVAADARAQLAQMTVSPAWRLATRLDLLRRRIAPEGSIAYRMLRFGWRVWRSGPALPGRRPQTSNPLVTLLLPAEKADPTRVLESVSSVLDQTESRWELLLLGETSSALSLPPDPRIGRSDASHPGRAGALNAGLAQALGTFVAVIEPGDQIVPSALRTLVDAATEMQADIVYSNEETLHEFGPAGQGFSKPDWSPELLLAFPYTGRLCILRRELAQALGGWHEETASAEDYALVLGAARRGKSIRRVERTLYRRYRTHAPRIYSTPEAVEARKAALVEHLQASGRTADIVDDDGPAKLRLRWPIEGQPLVSIIIATRDRVSLLDQCIRSIETGTNYRHYEIIIVDNDSAEPESRHYFEQTSHRVVPAPGPFNFSAVNNAGARAARGEYLLFLNNDTEVLTPDWLTAMLEWAQQPAIGCVGAKLMFPDGRIQHAGVTLHDGSAFHVGYGQRTDDRNWVESGLVRNFSAVTAACLMIRRRVFEDLGGFDETFPVAYNDVDLCVRLMRAGYRNLYTPFAVLNHHESASRPPGVAIEENEHLRQTVGPLIWADPYCPRDQLLDAPAALPARERRGARRLRRLATAVEVMSAAAWHRSSLKNAPELPASDRPGAIRWLDRVEIAGQVRIGLFMHPVSRRTFRITVLPGSRLVAWLALMPEVWNKNSGGVRFEVTISTEGVERQARTWVVDPRARRRDRSWRRITVALSRFAGQEIDLTLATSLPAGAALESAWAVWGNPVLVQRKSIAQIVRRQSQMVRSIGVMNTVRRYGRLLKGAPPIDSFTYQSWLQHHQRRALDSAELKRTIEAFVRRPRISVVTPVFNTDPRWLQRAVESVLAQAYGEWEHCLADDGSTRPETVEALTALAQRDPRITVVRMRQNAGISAASNAALAEATGEFIALLDHDDEIAPDALYEVAKLLNDHPDADVVYTDEDKIEFDGTHVEPYFKPDWSPEYLRSCMYIGHLTAYRRELVNEIGGFRSAFDGSQDYDLTLRATARTKRIYHIPRVLYHWRKIPGSAAADQVAKPWALDAARRALSDHLAAQPIPATVVADPGNGLWRVKYQILGEPLVTIVIPTDGRIARTAQGDRDLLSQCLRSIAERTTYRNYEVLIVDNGRLSPRVLDLLRNMRHRRVLYEPTTPFNFAAKVNFAVRHVRGEHVLLLNDDTEVINEEWLSAMLEFSQQPEIGAVGGKLYYPDGRLQHVGVVLGIGGGACHVLAGQAGNSPGYFGSALVIRNYSAVTGACCMTRRTVFEEVGGFDERFALDFNDVDYCLRVRARGYRIVGTPFARLYHYESATFGSRERIVNPQEISALSERWQDVIDSDPYYSPNLTRSALDYSLRL